MQDLTVNGGGHLVFAGADTVQLAKKHGTPLYLMDETRLRRNCRVYTETLRECFDSAAALYASKALCCKRLYEILAEENMGADVVSAGELSIAQKAGFPPEKLFFHGSSKPESEMRFALESGVGYFVVDNSEELDCLSRLVAEAGARQKILLRLTPGIDTHTFAAVRTGQVDSKFGVSIETGQALEFVRAALQTENIELCGFHCHIGSQIFENQPFLDAADIMLRFAAKVRDELNYTAKMLDLGGGYGVRYVESDPKVDIAANIRELATHIKALCASLALPVPTILLEPGRSIVADAMMTLYTVNAVKKIPGFKNYVAVDGGMTDNPRYALYGSVYTTLLANRADSPADFQTDIAGRCCESGDLIQAGALLPEPRRGDTLAVLVTGAYNYSMSSNYNGVCRPPIVLLNGGTDTVIVRRETPDDLSSRDV